MARPARITAAVVLAVAVIATFASGAHHNMPTRKVRMTAVFPGVTDKAIERGCAAWKEDVTSCLSGVNSTGSDWPSTGARPEIR